MKVIASCELHELPITALVQGRVEELGQKDGIAPVLTFCDPLVEDVDADADDFPSIAGVEDDGDVTAVTEAKTVNTNHKDDDHGHCHLTNDKIEIINLTGEEEDAAEEECQNTKAQLKVTSVTPLQPGAQMRAPDIKQEGG